MAALRSAAQTLLAPVAVLAGSALLGVAIALVTVRVLRGIAAARVPDLAPAIGARLRLPLLLLFPTLVLAASLPFAGLPDRAVRVVADVDRVVAMLAAAWVVLRVLTIGEDVLLARYRVDVDDNLKARKVHTQIRYMRRIASVVVVVIAVGAVLLTFEEIQQLGTTLLTTAGVAGVIVGFAAQKTLATVIAGLQIAFTQPIRLGDAVIVENEWGWIEEITLTYVVVKLWDWRRLVVPIGYFLDNVFQNWTRSSSRMIGSVFLYLDYRFPVAAMRDELSTILRESDLWDGGVEVVQVTDCTERTMQLRVLVSATSSPRLWDLRCLVRERLVAFVQESYPQMLPRFRAELGSDDGRAAHEAATPGSRGASGRRADAPGAGA